MNKKNLILTILTIITSTTVSAGTVFADKPDFSNKNIYQFEQKQGYSNKQNNFNRKTSIEVFIINQRLNHIEASLNEINARMDAYFSENGASASDPSQTTTGSSIESGTQPENSTGQTGDTVDSTGTNTSTTSSAIDTQQTTGSDDISNQDPLSTSESNSISDEDNETVNSGDEQDLSCGFQKEYEDEDSELNISFYGKLNAVMNRLNTVKRQLSRINSTDDPQIAQLNTRTDDLINKAKASIAKLSSIQQQNVDSLKDKANKKEMEDENINDQKKSWKIRFSRAIKPDTVNSKNILVIDSQNNVVDTNISYNSDTKEVTIQAKNGFKKGESYSILIGDDVQSMDGEKLKISIEKKFNVK